MANQKNNLEYKYEAELVVKGLDEKIDEYVKKELVPMLLPVDASEKEKNQLARLLFQVVALDVYKDKLIKTYDLLKRPGSDIPSILIQKKVRPGEIIEQRNGKHDFDFSYQDLSDQVVRILSSRRPKQTIENRILRLKHDDSPYRQKYHCPEGERPFYKTRDLQLLASYANQYRKIGSVRDFKAAISVHHQIKTILELREYFHNQGSLENVPLHSAHYENGTANKIFASMVDYPGIVYQVRTTSKKIG